MKTQNTNRKNWVKPEVQRLNITKDTHGGTTGNYEGNGKNPNLRINS